MTLEAATYITGLNTAYPEGGADRSTASDHLQLIKAVVKASFPGVSGPVTPAQSALNCLRSLTEDIQPMLRQLSLSISLINTQLATVKSGTDSASSISISAATMRTQVDDLESAVVKASTVDTTHPVRNTTYSATYNAMLVFNYRVQGDQTSTFTFNSSDGIALRNKPVPSLAGDKFYVLTAMVRAGARWWWSDTGAFGGTVTTFMKASV
jgi:hypothetical protein